MEFICGKGVKCIVGWLLRIVYEEQRRRKWGGGGEGPATPNMKSGRANVCFRPPPIIALKIYLILVF